MNIYKTLKFGREDLNRPRQDVFTRHEANGPESRFYQLIQRRMFKRRILSWFEDIKSSARKGDRIVIILCAHGQSETGDVILKCGGVNEVLTQVEIYTKLDGLIPGVRLLLVNEACYSGSWTEAIRQPRGAELLHEAASRKNEKSYDYRSTSDNIRCSLFAAAFVQELENNPEGQIRQHTKRIAAEISHVGPSQLRSPPEFAKPLELTNKSLHSNSFYCGFHQERTSTPKTARRTAHRVSVCEGYVAATDAGGHTATSYGKR